MSRRIAVVSGGLRQPSSTRLLADRMAEAVERALREAGEDAVLDVVELRDHAQDLTAALLTGFATERLTSALETITTADGLVAVTPIFSGSYSGLFKNAVDVLEDGALEGMPVLMGATAGTARHSLALEHAVRPLFSYLRTITVPTAVFAATEDFGQAAGSTTGDVVPLGARIDRGARELAALVAGRPPRGAAGPRDPFALTVNFEDLLGG
ncbi:FMN reductase [Actinotalea sp. JY-7876]|uniref:FMN reductase n=1 Tax=Actinotalea sp. JY-7876 TaxID=2758442 RepID=UPI0015F65FDC|nr:FMN reductase [Actinotalea sp. JY-7876]